MELNWKGARYRRSLETTDRETGLIKLDAEVAAIRAGELPKKFDPIAVQSMFDAFIVRVEVDCKERTVRDYKSSWNVHLKSFFGTMAATQVAKDTITAYLRARVKEGAGMCARNCEQRALMMIFGHNESKIPADRIPELPRMQWEKSHVRKRRLSKTNYDNPRRRLDDPKIFWLKAFVTLTFTYGFRRPELSGAKLGYFDPNTSALTLPAFTTKNKMERVVDIRPEGEIYRILVKRTEGRDSNAPLFRRNGRSVKDCRGKWKKQTADIKGGSGKGDAATLRDLRRSAITKMNEKGVTAAEAGTHLTADVFSRYITSNQTERRETAKLIEG